MLVRYITKYGAEERFAGLNHLPSSLQPCLGDRHTRHRFFDLRMGIELGQGRHVLFRETQIRQLLDCVIGLTKGQFESLLALFRELETQFGNLTAGLELFRRNRVSQRWMRV